MHASIHSITTGLSTTVSAALIAGGVAFSPISVARDSLTTLRADVDANAADIVTNAGEISNNASGIATNAGGISTNASGISTNATGISTNASGIATNTSGITTNAADIATNTGGIAANASDISANQGSISTNADGIAANAADITTTQGAVCEVADAVGVCDDIDFCAGLCSSTVVFVTSTLLTGSAVGGLAGADAECQALADGAGLTGTFAAWLSDSTTNAADRLTQSTAPYVRTDGQTVAADWTDLISATELQAAISVDENGAAIAPPFLVWTGTGQDGTATADTCTDWTVDAGNGVAGVATQVAKPTWTNANSFACGTARRLYCVQQ